jgi:RNA polymerase sigma factor (TIGR02999 family)
MSETTALLRSWAEGDEGARDRLIEHLYPELRRFAAWHLRRARSDASLQTSDLVHETYLRLVDQRRARWRDRAHFFAVSAGLIRRILADHLRARRRLKRGGGLPALTLADAAGLADDDGHPDLLLLDEALDRLAEIDARAARIVELRYYGGLSYEEVAAVLGIGRATVVRAWRFARAWLHETLASPDGLDGGNPRAKQGR